VESDGEDGLHVRAMFNHLPGGRLNLNHRLRFGHMKQRSHEFTEARKFLYTGLLLRIISHLRDGKKGCVRKLYCDSRVRKKRQIPPQS
jgi:hypothetical protein